MSKDEDIIGVPDAPGEETAEDTPRALISMNVDGAHGFFTDDGRAHLSLEDLPGEFAYHVDGRLDAGGRGRLLILTISPKRGPSPEDGQNITAKTLREVPVDLIRHQLEYALSSPWSERVGKAAWLAGDAQLPSPGRRPPPEHFLQVAWVWMQAEREGKPPRAAIAKRWGVSEDTATRWARKSRQLGWLEDYDHTKTRESKTATSEADFEETRQLIEMQIFLKKLRELASDGPGPIRETAEACERAIHEASHGSWPGPSRVFKEYLLETAGPESDSPLAEAVNTLLTSLKEAGRLGPLLTPDDRASIFVNDLSDLADEAPGPVQEAATALLALLSKGGDHQGLDTDL